MTGQKLFQSNLDALCGIYALANFLQRQPEFQGYKERPGQLALAAALRAAEREHLFDTAHMMQGYDWAELGRIARRIFADYHFDFQIEPLKNLEAKTGADLFKSTSELVKNGGSAIIKHSQGNHWVFVYGVDNESIKIKDSAPTSGGSSVLSSAQLRRVPTTDGLVFRKLIKKSK